jgi:hypothetical protein
VSLTDHIVTNQPTSLVEEEEEGISNKASAYHPTWILLATASHDYTYYFINASPESEYYGKIKDIVLNMSGDTDIAESLEALWELVDIFIEQRIVFEKIRLLDGATLHGIGYRGDKESMEQDLQHLQKELMQLEDERKHRGDP